jgi:hypothetical protein
VNISLGLFFASHQGMEKEQNVMFPLILWGSSSAFSATFSYYCSWHGLLSTGTCDSIGFEGLYNYWDKQSLSLHW